MVIGEFVYNFVPRLSAGWCIVLVLGLVYGDL